jgi:hypothetical protein
MAEREDTNQALSERLQKIDDRQPTVAYCAFCPEWEATGTAEETRAAQVAHRAEHHPETFRKRAKRATRKFAQRNLSREAEEQLDRERRARLRQLGIDVKENE